MREWWSKFCAVFGSRRAIDEDLDEELRAHRELEMEENVARGMTPDAARRAFGNNDVD